MAEPGGDTLYGTLVRLGAHLLDALRTRVELASSEIEHELLALVVALFAGVAAIVAGGFALLLAVLFVVAAFWDEHRLLAIGLSCALFVAIAAIAAGLARRHLVRREGVLAATLEALRHDSERLRRRP